MASPRLLTLLERTPSNDRLGKELVALWREAEPDADNIPKPRSLGAYVGQLRRGNDTWWRAPERAVVRRVLARLLELPEAALGLSSDRPSSIPFPAFPALGELDGRGEGPARLGLPELDVMPTERQARWLIWPAGFGRTLTAQWLALREEARVVSVGDLADALDAADEVDGWVVVDLRGQEEGPEECAAVKHLGARGRVLVLAARGPCPELRRRVVERSAPGAAEWAEVHGWELGHWRPHADWQARLARWVIDRLGGDTDLDADALQASWDRGELEQPSTPAQAIEALELLHHWGVSDPAGEPDLPARYIRRRLAPGGRAASQFGEDLTARGPDLLAAVVSTLLAAGADPRADRAATTWQDLVGAADPPLRSSDLDEFDPTAEDAGARWEELRGRAVRAGAQSVVEHLIEAGLLIGDDREHLGLRPSWLVGSLQAAGVAAEIRGDEVDSWGRLLLDPRWAPVVDGVLVGLPAEDFASVVRRVVADWRRASLPRVAAAEALLVAGVRRLPKGHGRSPLGFDLVGLLQRQIETLVPRHPDGEPTPVTRSLVDGRLAAAQWLRTCWVASAVLPEGGWAHVGMPDWATPFHATLLRLEGITELRGVTPDSPGAGATAAELFWFFVESFDRLVMWVDLPDELPAPEELPVPFQPLLLLEALRSQPGSARALVLALLEGAPWADWFLDRLVALDDEGEELLQRIWGLLPAYNAGLVPLLDSLSENPRLRDLLLRLLPPSAYEEVLSVGGLGPQNDLLALVTAPLRVRQVALGWALRTGRIFEADLGPDPAPVLELLFEGPQLTERLVRGAGRLQTPLAAAMRQQAWALDPEETRRLLVALATDPGAFDLLLHAAPMDQAPPLLAWLADRPAQRRGSAVRGWLGRVVAEAGEVAHRTLAWELLSGSD